MTGPIVFIAADRRECAPWVARWSVVEPAGLPVHWAQCGTWRGRRMIAIANGAGIERAFMAAMLVRDAVQLWNIGFAGAADPSLRVGDVVAATCVQSDSGHFRCASPRSSNPFHAAIVKTVPAVMRTAREKCECHQLGASAVEMEAAGIARAAAELDVPFYCVRSISDLADEDLVNDFNKALMHNGRFSALRLIAGAARNPLAGFGELMRLRQRTSIAARNLGEFLAHCEY